VSEITKHTRKLISDCQNIQLLYKNFKGVKHLEEMK